MAPDVGQILTGDTNVLQSLIRKCDECGRISACFADDEYPQCYCTH